MKKSSMNPTVGHYEATGPAALVPLPQKSQLRKFSFGSPVIDGASPQLGYVHLQTSPCPGLWELRNL